MGRPLPARDERGAVVPIVAALIGLLIAVTAFTVDLGTQRIARTDMQSLADLVALDASRSLAGQTTTALLTGGGTTFPQGVMDSVNRNRSTLGSAPVVLVELGTYAGSTFTATGSLRYVAGAAGVSNVTVTTGATVPSAVRVSTGTTTAFSFVPGSGAANRSAVAVTDSSACFEVGSYAAAVRSGDSTLLNSLLGALPAGSPVSAVDLQAVGYQGLANTTIQLSDLAVALGVGTVEQLATTTVSYASLYSAVAQVLNANGQVAAANLLQSMSVKAGAVGSVAVGSLIGLDTGSGAVAKASTNVLDLIAASAFLINGSNLLSVPFSIGAPNLASLTGSIKLLEGLQKQCGRVGTTARTAQVDVTASSGLNIGAGGLTVGSYNVKALTGSPLTLSLSAASTSATLASVTCQTPSSSVQGASLTMNSGLINVSLNVPLEVSAVNISLFGLPLVSFDIVTTVKVNASFAPSTGTFTFTIPPQQFDTAYSTGTSNVSFGAPTHVESSVTASALGIPILTLTGSQIDQILSPVISSVVTPIVNGVTSALVSPLLNLLGIRVAGADVILDSTPPLSCSVPSLRQ